MKYVTVIAQTQPDGTVNAEMTVHDEYQKAVSAYHMELAYGAVSDKLASDMAMLADTTGNVYETCVVQGLAKPVEEDGASETGTTTDTAAGTAAGE